MADQVHGELLSRLVQSFPGLAYRCLHDADWTLEFASDGSFDLLGYTADELVVERVVAISDLVHPDDLSAVSLGVERAVTDRTSFHLQYRMRTRDGVYKWISEVGHGIFDADGNLEAIEGFLSDVTAEVEAREAAHSSERREVAARMASGVAHDFNNIVMAIRVTAESIRRAIDSGDGKRATDELGVVQGLVDRAAGLTQQLLAFGSPRAVKTDPIDVVETLRALRKMLVHVVGKTVTLRIHLPSKPLACRIDPVQLEQVIMNLVVNGRDAMPDGGQLTITLEESERGASFSVADEGSGIAPEKLAHVFDPYYTTKGDGGTGLGLATVRSIVEEVGGTIDVESTVGNGTMFRFAVPLIDSAPATVNFGTEVVLLADDQPEVRHAVARGLRRLGYTVLEAADGEQALKISRRHKGQLDLVLADGRMPNMDGLELAKALRADRPELVAVLLSGDSATPSPPFSHVVRKPATIDEIAAILRRALDAR